jgi:pimeloyl-ACP methyl ester carboxylesterase
MAVGLESLTNFDFRPNQPYRACLICGEVFQTDQDRTLSPTSHPNLHIAARQTRDLWAVEHAKRHSNKQHKLLKVSGHAMTLEAAQRLAAFGLIDVGSLVLSEEYAEAYAEAPSVPTSDAVH